MIHGSAVVAIGCAIGIGLTVVPAFAKPAAGPSGRIAFSRYRFVDNPLRREIWVSKVDGTGPRRLSHAPANYLDSSPSWHPTDRGSSSRVAHRILTAPWVTARVRFGR